MVGTLALLGAGGATVYALMPWKTKAQISPGDPLYSELLQLLNAAESQYGIPHDLLARQAWEESHFDPNATNPSGAQGLMQFEPATAAQYGVTNPFDPAQAAAGAGAYMAALFNQFGRWGLALAAYDAGPGNVTKYGGIPPFPETQNYVSDILSDVNAELGTNYA